MMRKHSCC